MAVATINKMNRFSDMKIQHLLEGKKEFLSFNCPFNAIKLNSFEG